MRFRRFAERVCWMTLCLVAGLGSSLRAQDTPPDQPFQAVHLLWIDTQQPDAEHRVQTAVASLNRAIVKAGCPDCTYHLWKVVDAAKGSYNYVQVSSWPSGAVYSRVHASPEYLAASKGWGMLRSVVVREAYNRYVEVGLDQGGSSAAVAAAPPARR